MTSTRDNPGAFNVRSTQRLGDIATKAFRRLRNRDYSGAALGTFVDSLNLFEATATNSRTKRYRCSCCGYEAHAFQHIVSGHRVVWNSACPGCNSRSRHRGLAVLLPRLLDQRQPKRVLHFAPEPVLRRFFADRNLTYETADLYLEDATHSQIDVQNMPFADGSYDFVLCNHVLEHVADDGAALAEIARVLAPSGVAVITVPGDFRRVETVLFEGELPNGHFRDYGMDLIPRLETAFTKVDAIDMHSFDREREGLSHAIRARDMVFVCER
jgi:SAM-dependent methyltransferase